MYIFIATITIECTCVIVRVYLEQKCGHGSIVTLWVSHVLVTVCSLSFLLIGSYIFVIAN
jgi:hypothetical protein